MKSPGFDQMMGLFGRGLAVAAMLVMLVQVAVAGEPGGKEPGETITWMQLDFPPYVIKNGEYRGKGIDDLIVRDMRKYLDSYVHVLQEANLQRLLQMLADKEKVLTTPLFKTAERQQYVHYPDVASYLVLPNYFILRSADIPRFTPYLTDDGAIDIEKVLGSEDLRVGVNLGRSYGGIIDKTVKTYSEGEKIYYLKAQNLSGSMLSMLLTGRIDATFEFPATLKYFTEIEGFDGSVLTALPVSGMDSYIPIFFGAPRSAWGEKVIREIETYLHRPGIIAAFVGYYQSWLGPNELPQYKKVLEMYYAEQYPEIYRTLDR